ncbi:hypothetical protein IDJ75_09935 [Mucilaginibacter rigui]|uniref:Uncharacterized protein n=1 Tax=Mucilaginibacter rigui TaxID=534635 RepID=A0ABR7X4T7_9SPHI|nr:hypothetical protein [Mucilaginibacter rigui]MBD1385596.1 hypothetical protein [Mucilaginibacter rigui]
MLTKIGRKKFLEKYPDFPTASEQRNIFHFPEVYAGYVLYVEHKSDIGLGNNLAKATQSLVETLCCKELNFLGDTKTPWVYQDNEYKPITQGIIYFKENKLDGHFIGGINVPSTRVSEFIKHLYWLVRGNSIVNYVHFSNPEFTFIGSVCQYGNLHFHTLNKKIDLAFNENIAQCGFHISENGECGGGRIKGRKYAYKPYI